MYDGYDQLTRESLTIGRVVEVSPSMITVAIDVEAPHGTSFAHGALQRFPRVNGFVVLPSENGAILAVVLWIGIDEAVGYQRTLPPDVLGLPAARRRLRAIPLGLLRSHDLDGEVRLERGALLFPSVGDPVRLPTAHEATAAVPTVGQHVGEGGQVGLQLGLAPMAAHACVSIDANKIFARHLAILGNTGSGKSCSLTHIMRESARQAGEAGAFRAVLFDLNGDYGRAFDDLETDVPVKRFTIGARDGAASGTHRLRVPYWLWNYREWHAFIDPSGKSQAPVLRQALHMLRTSRSAGLPRGVLTLIMGKRVVREIMSEQVVKHGLEASLSSLDKVMESCAHVAEALPEGEAREALRALYTDLQSVLNPKRDMRPGRRWAYGVGAPNGTECENLRLAFTHALKALGVPSIAGNISSVDIPIPFNAEDLVDLLGVIAVDSGSDVAGWVAPMQDRLAVAMSDERLISACGYEEGETLESWLRDLLGESSKGQITVLDLSLVPSQAQQLVAGVIARMLLETLERQRRVGDQVPVILAVEEAHALIRRKTDMGGTADGASGTADLCRESFERIGREGRKFGLSLVVSSQRPSELSETVLSQCNSYMVHRIVNYRDQELVRRLVPDNLGALLDEIASYPARTALLVGAAADIPVLVEVSELDERYRPNSADPNFRQVWSTGVKFNVSYVATDWAPPVEVEPSPPPIPSPDLDGEPPF